MGSLMMAVFNANSTCTCAHTVVEGTAPSPTIVVSAASVSPLLLRALRQIRGIRVICTDEAPSISCAICAGEGTDVAAYISRPAFERSPDDQILGCPKVGRTRRTWKNDYG